VAVRGALSTVVVMTQMAPRLQLGSTMMNDAQFPSIDDDELARVTGAGFAKDWWPDIKGALGPGAAGVVAGATCFGGLSLALGGSFFVPPSAPGWAAFATHGLSYACSATAATLAHHYMK
jgi:hypothetical protein